MPGPALDDPATSATSRYFFSFNCARCLFCARSLFPASLDRRGFRPAIMVTVKALGRSRRLARRQPAPFAN